jgi:quercetin dioxygenase-like cupin family protein
MDKSAIRRIVTGHDNAGVARIAIDDYAANAKHFASGPVSTLIWSTDQCPADIAIGDNFEDCGARILGTAPPPHGSRFTVIDFPAGSAGSMHRTDTLDYVVVISGDIEMQTDDETTQLKAGDVLVQRGTNHSWINRSERNATLAFVLIDAIPIGIGQAITGNATAK